MVTETIDPIKELDKALKLIEKKRKKIKRRKVQPKNKEPEKQEKPKEAINEQGMYTPLFKVAAIFSMVGLVCLCVSSFNTPDIYSVMMAIIDYLNPFNNVSIDPDLDHYVN